MPRIAIFPWVHAALFVLGASLFQCGNTNTEKLSKDSGATPASEAEFKGLDFIEFNTGGAPEGTDLPVVIVIHGLGDTPENLGNLFRGAPFKARVVLPRAPSSWGHGFSWFDVRVPVGKSEIGHIGAGVRGAGSRICDFVNSANLKRKPVVTGFSQGGILAFTAAVTCPEHVGLAIPISGLLPPELMPEDFSNAIPPIRALHGDVDDLVPYEHAVSTVKSLKSKGVDATLRTFPGVPHQITPSMRQYVFDLISDYLK